jgi:fumarate hydratase subunit alpha
MKKVFVDDIIDLVKKKVIDINIKINDDILKALKDGFEIEESECGKDILNKLIKNSKIAKDDNIAICQDTGLVVVFVEFGQEITIIGGTLEEALNEGIRRGYKEGCLRNSVVSDPILRVNTNDNTPAVIHYDIVKGDNLKISIMPKGFGSENMSRLSMLKPSQGINGVKEFILETVEKAGPNPCPPIVVGVGMGGTFEKAAILSKRALLRPINKRNRIEYIEELEIEMLEKINMLGIGPGGLGGRVTAIGVNIEVYPTHIAGLPVAINISCHATRHGEILL